MIQQFLRSFYHSKYTLQGEITLDSPNKDHLQAVHSPVTYKNKANVYSKILGYFWLYLVKDARYRSIIYLYHSSPSGDAILYKFDLYLCFQNKVFIPYIIGPAGFVMMLVSVAGALVPFWQCDSNKFHRQNSCGRNECFTLVLVTSVTAP